MKKLTLFCLFTLPFVVTAQVPAGIIANYPFDNALSDISGNSYNGSLTATTAAANRFGEAGKATKFVAGPSTGQLPGTLQTAMRGDFSLGFWFNTLMIASPSTQWHGGNSMIDAEVCGGATDWGTSLINGGKVAFGIGGDATIISPLDYNDGDWHFVTATRNRSVGTFTLYVDGTQIATTIGSPGDLIAPAFIGIGNNPCNPTPKYTGLLDDIVVYDRILTNTEVLNLYNFSSLATLPLKWLEFTGSEKNNQVVLHWKVANIVNVESFDVESSIDGKQFAFTGSVRAKAGVSDYSYQPSNKVAVGINYFRIRHVDHDGKSTYSDIINIRTGLQNNTMSLARNPVSSLVSINNPNQTIIHQLTVSDATGRKLILQQKRTANSVVNVDISKLQPGQYFISVFAGGNSSVFPFLKQ